MSCKFWGAFFSSTYVVNKSPLPQQHTCKTLIFPRHKSQNFRPNSLPKKIFVNCILNVYIPPSHRKESKLCSILYLAHVVNKSPLSRRHMHRTVAFPRCQSPNFRPKSLPHKRCLELLYRGHML